MRCGDGVILKKSVVVSLSLQDIDKSVWRSQKLEFTGQGRALWRKQLHRERKLWRYAEVSLQHRYVRKLSETKEKPLKRIRRNNP